MSQNNRVVCGLRSARLGCHEARGVSPRTFHVARCTAPLIVFFIVLALTACGGSGTGDSDESLTGAVNSTRAHYQIIELASGRVTAAGSVPDLTTNLAYRSTHVVFRLVEVGGGMIGTTSAQLGAAIDSAASAVGATSFYLAVFETTQAQWQALGGGTPWTLLSSAAGIDDVRTGDDLPAVGLSQDLVGATLSAYQTSRGVRLWLPSDVQWEVACRGGGTSTFSWGESMSSTTVTAAAVVWETAGAQRGARAVGGRVPSALGFFDLHGNVWELSAAGNLRGGSWNDPLANARAAHRAAIDPTTRHLLVGARLVYLP